MKEGSLLGIIRYDAKAFFIALVLHTLLLFVLVVSVNFAERPDMPHKQVETVQAVVVDSQIVQAELEKIKKIEARKKSNEKLRLEKLADKTRKEEHKQKQAQKKRKQEEQRIADLKKERKADEKQRKVEVQQLADLQKKKQLLEEQRQAEQQRLAVIQKKRQQEELARDNARKAEEEEKRKKIEAIALKKKLAEEEQQRYLNSSKMKKLRSQYVKLIERHVGKKWIKPASANKEMFCNVIITQNRAGTVLSVKTDECKGDKAFQQSVERAVLKASPLPDPPSADVFDRTVQFTFVGH
ncbi:MAG: cell envelope integrity protein TolA [Gammaproteobacteria bacterium]|nr:cell envelope integrity protein TolA [Gammaproteobacteria bacterium]